MLCLSNYEWTILILCRAFVLFIVQNQKSIVMVRNYGKKFQNNLDSKSSPGYIAEHSTVFRSQGQCSISPFFIYKSKFICHFNLTSMLVLKDVKFHHTWEWKVSLDYHDKPVVHIVLFSQWRSQDFGRTGKILLLTNGFYLELESDLTVGTSSLNLQKKKKNSIILEKIFVITGQFSTDPLRNH